MTNLCALLVACAALQSPAGTPATKAEANWIELDRVVAIVNQDIITYRQMARDLKREKEARQLKNQSEMQAARDRILTRRMKALLSKQAGQDMGADEKAVERTVQDSLDRIVEGNNGVVGMSKLMQSKDVNTQDVKKEIREELYSRTFLEAVTGEGSGVSARPNRDRYVRPGELKFHYQRALREPELLGLIGGSTETVTLQTLTLDSDKNGGRELTMTLAGEIQKSIESGAEDMSELVRRNSMYKTNDGVQQPVEIARLRRLDAALAKFVDERPTDPALWAKYVSGPIGILESGTRIVVRLARIREIAPGTTPALDSNRTQEQITKQARESLDDYRLDRAFAKLHEAAYIWPPELAAPQER